MYEVDILTLGSMITFVFLTFYFIRNYFKAWLVATALAPVIGFSILLIITQSPYSLILLFWIKYIYIYTAIFNLVVALIKFLVTNESVPFYAKKLMPSIKKSLPIFFLAFAFLVLGAVNQKIILDLISKVFNALGLRTVPVTKEIKLPTRKINDTFKCPSPETVVANKNHVGVFYANKQHWSYDYSGWGVPDVMTFMQVIIYNTGNVVCYYNWLKPNEQGTKLWMTVKLSSDVMQNIKPFGTFWNNKDKKNFQICSSGIDACAINSKKRSPLITNQSKKNEANTLLINKKLNSNSIDTTSISNNSISQKIESNCKISVVNACSDDISVSILSALPAIITGIPKINPNSTNTTMVPCNHPYTIQALNHQNASSATSLRIYPSSNMNITVLYPSQFKDDLSDRSFTCKKQ